MATGDPSMMKGMAAHIYAVENPYDVRNQATKLQRRIMELQEAMLTAQDWPDFKMRVGHIRGLQEAIAMLNDSAEAK